MRKTLLLYVLLSMSSFAFANVDLFGFNEEKLEQEFAELNRLEGAVINNSEMNLAMAEALNFLPDEFSSASANGFEGSEFRFQWEGFLWGFLCCPVGVFVVALSKNETKDNKTSFWIGVAASAVLSSLQTIAVGGGTYYAY